MQNKGEEQMKKHIVMTLCLLLVFTFTSCKADADNVNLDDKKTEIMEEIKVVEGDGLSKNDKKPGDQNKVGEEKSDNTSIEDGNSDKEANDTLYSIPLDDTNISLDRELDEKTCYDTNSNKHEIPKEDTITPPVIEPEISHKEEKEETPTERTVTVKVPIYGEQYTLHWIKDKDGNIVYSTKSSNEAQTKRLEMIADPNIEPSWTWGSSGHSDIIGYEEYTIPVSEYYESNFTNRDDVTVIWN